MTRGFGLDLAGYSTRKSELAVAEVVEGDLAITLLGGSPFSRTVRSDANGATASTADRSCLLRLLKLGRLAVDVPIDLQGLPAVPTSDRVWGQTKRPIDKALNALPPFADRIGSVVARFQAIVATGEVTKGLGVTLFETYPSACLVALGHSGKGYKGERGAAGRGTVGRYLRLEDDKFSDDELDAIICALTALGPDVLEGASLQSYLGSKIGGAALPKGYRLLAEAPRTMVKVLREPYEGWLARQ